MKKCTTYDNNILWSKWSKNIMDNGRRNKIFDTKWIAWCSKMIWKKHELNYANDDESNTNYGIEWIEKHEMTCLYMLLYFFSQLFTNWSTRRRKWWYYWMNMNVSFISTFYLTDLIWCNIHLLNVLNFEYHSNWSIFNGDFIIVIISNVMMNFQMILMVKIHSMISSCLSVFELNEIFRKKIQFNWMLKLPWFFKAMIW